jgi:thymidylate kinase
MLVIFEGVDKVGKTFLIDNVKQHISDASGIKTMYWKFPDRVQLAKSSRAGADLVYGHFLATANILMSKEYTNCVHLLDRFFPSQLVYGQLRDIGVSEEVRKMYLQLETDIADKNVLLVYVYAKEETLKERFESEPDDYITYADVKKLQEWYAEYLKTTKLEVIKVQSSQAKEVSELIQKLYTKFRKKKEPVKGADDEY